MNRRQLQLDHLTTGQVAAMLDRRLPDEERTTTVAHLSVCAECRHELAELQRALKATEHRPRATRRWAFAVSGAAAALLITAAPIAMRSMRQTSDPVPARATRAGNIASIDASSSIPMVTPADGAEISPTRALTWRSSGVGASYVVTVQDTSGSVIWSFSLTDTSATIPSTVSLLSGRRYFWSVEARLADGASAATGARAFKAP